MLVGLRAETPHPAPSARVLTIPLRTHRVGTVLDDGNAVAVANGFNRFQVSNVAAHVRQQKDLGATGCRLKRQIGHIRHVVWRGFDQNRIRTCVGNCTGHRRQREGAGQHFVTGLNAQSFKRNEHGRTA